MPPTLPSVSGHVQGQVKVSVQYLRGQLQIMVHHARNLSLIGNGQEPSPYVKLYLLEDPHKRTKRKTKVVKKTCHPTFMELVSIFVLFFICARHSDVLVGFEYNII